MGTNLQVRKWLAVGIIIFFICINLESTSLAQWKITSSKQEIKSQPSVTTLYVPYLEIILADETKIFYPTDDTYIANYNIFEINGDLDILATRNRYGEGSDIWECDILIRFDISSIPRSTSIISASLNLYYAGGGDSSPEGRPLTVYKILNDWDEMTVNFNSKLLVTSSLSSVENVPNSIDVWMSWDVTKDVQHDVNATEDNFGWKIMDETYWGMVGVPVAYFYSKEYVPPDPPFCPYLEVELTDEIKTFTPSDDTYIANYDRSEMNGHLDFLAIRNRFGAYDNIWECDILIRFALSSIPKSTQILSASLNLYYAVYGGMNPVGRSLNIYRAKWFWNERTVNFFKKPWIASVVSDSQIIPDSVGVGIKWDVTNDVQYQVNHSGRNFGWEIRDDSYWGSFEVPTSYFYSKEYFHFL